jgi:hypothetical protein
LCIELPRLGVFSLDIFQLFNSRGRYSYVHIYEILFRVQSA